jgi:hypothetical protein
MPLWLLAVVVGEVIIFFCGTLVAGILWASGENLDLLFVIMVGGPAIGLAAHALIALKKFRRELLRLPAELRYLVWSDVRRELVLPFFLLVASLGVAVAALWQDSSPHQLAFLAPVALMALLWAAMGVANGFASGMHKAREQARLHSWRVAQANRVWQQHLEDHLGEPKTPAQSIQVRGQITETAPPLPCEGQSFLEGDATP